MSGLRCYTCLDEDSDFDNILTGFRFRPIGVREFTAKPWICFQVNELTVSNSHLSLSWWKTFWRAFSYIFCNGWLQQNSSKDTRHPGINHCLLLKQNFLHRMYNMIGLYCKQRAILESLGLQECRDTRWMDVLGFRTVSYYGIQLLCRVSWRGSLSHVRLRFGRGSSLKDRQACLSVLCCQADHQARAPV
jgi:hypothetical protein